MVKFQFRKPSRYKDNWNYVYWGETQQAVCDKANAWRMLEIKELEERAENIRQQLLKPEPGHG